MLIRKLSVALCLLLPLPGIESLAQQTPSESCDVPVVVTRFDASFQDLGTKDFVVRLGTTPVSLQSASVDRGPKRVALILDAS
jgi:hypothetical protein